MTQEQQKATKQFIEFCNIKRLRKTLTAKILTSALAKPPTESDKEEIQDFTFLYMFLEDIDLKG